MVGFILYTLNQYNATKMPSVEFMFPYLRKNLIAIGLMFTYPINSPVF